jgi:chorismate--pyruvate lyase
VAKLGGRSLGTALFTQPGAKRSGLAFRSLRRTDALYARAASLLRKPAVQLWARRSLFLLHGARIVVTEVFLPGIAALDHDAH